MRISDWSSDVCSSDLFTLRRQIVNVDGTGFGEEQQLVGTDPAHRPGKARHRQIDLADIVAAITANVLVAECRADRRSRRRRDLTRRADAGEQQLDVIDLQRLIDLETVFHLRRSEAHTSELQYLMR